MGKRENRYCRRSRIAEKEFRRLIKAFAMDFTATDAAELIGLSLRSVNAISRHTFYLHLKETGRETVSDTVFGGSSA